MSFWGNKLGPVAPPPPQQQPQQRYGSDVLPRGMGGGTNDMQRAVNDYVSRLPGQAMAPPGTLPTQFGVQQPQGWQPKSAAENPSNVSDVLPIWHWQGDPRGGAGETATLGPCPHCGSNNYFSRSSGMGNVVNTQTGAMVPPTPECFECGYPRLQGQLGTATVTGPAHAARQGAAPAPAPGTIGTLTR